MHEFPGSEKKEVRRLHKKNGEEGGILRFFFPFGRMLALSGQEDPLIAIALPDERLQKEISLISAYYLSFLE